MHLTRNSKAFATRTISTLAQRSSQLFSSISRRTLQTPPSASPHRQPGRELHAQDVNRNSDQDMGNRENLLLMEEAWAKEPGRPFLINVPTLLGEHPQSDRPVGRRECRAIARVIARSIPRLFLVTSQIACITVDHAYEKCHHGITRPSPNAIETCTHLKSVLPHALHSITHTSTPLFLIAALTHGVLAALQYHLNRSDRHQDLCLNVGVAVGLIACLPSLVDPAGRLAIVSTLAMAVTFSLAASAMGHLISPLYFVTHP